MNNFTTELTKVLVTKGDINELFREHLEKAINLLLQSELSEFLNYDKHSREGWNSGNSRNGFYGRTFHTEYGKLDLKIPRDRNGLFTNQTLEPYERRSDSLENTVIHMFQKGMSSRDIGNVIGKMYGHHYSATTISNMTKVVDELVDSFNKRPLASRYTCIFLDATVIPIRRGTVEQEAIYIAIGIRANGTKEILGYYIAPTESAFVWGEFLMISKSVALMKYSCLPQMALQVFVAESLNATQRHVIKHVLSMSNEISIQKSALRIARKLPMISKRYTTKKTLKRLKRS